MPPQSTPPGAPHSAPHHVRREGGASLYRPSGPHTRDVLDGLVRDKVPVFAMPSWFVSAEAAQVGHLLSRLLDGRTSGAPGEPHQAFYANSRHEALHGAIKLLRHGGRRDRTAHGGAVLVLDGSGRLRATLDPLGVGPGAALVPGVECVPDTDGFGRALRGRAYCGALIVAPGRLGPAAVREAARRARGAGVPVCLDLSDSGLDWSGEPDGEALLLAARPDLVVVGERLTGYEVPFAAVVGTAAAFAPWNEPGNAFLHSNTYGGNTLAMRKVKHHLAGLLGGDPTVRETLERADRDWRAVLCLYAAHVNPETVRLHRRMRGALHVVRADGARLTVELDSGRRLDLVDAVCGGGLGVNGHNPDDARTAVLAEHDTAADYCARLETVLAEETGLARAFPGVSGASAVETAITLAVLARERRRRIIVFRHNYGGKTLAALVATAAEATRAPFGPLYDGVTYLDPFAPDAPERLRRETASGDVGLVWLELVHGSSDTYRPLPDELLAAVEEQRRVHGLLVGVDEVLTSFYRCGRRFAHQGRLPHVDIVTVSKALSYLCFPVASTIVSEEVYERARLREPGLVEELRTRYRNQLGAHFGLHSIAQVDALGLPERTRELERVLGDAMDAMPERSPSVGRRFREGLFVRLEMIPPGLPRLVQRLLPARYAGRLAAKAGEWSVIAATTWWITRARVFVLYDCLGVPLIAEPRDAARIGAGIRALARRSPARLLAAAAFHQIEQSLLAAVRRARAR